jgi:hypothetical protein
LLHNFAKSKMNFSNALVRTNTSRKSNNPFVSIIDSVHLSFSSRSA